MLIKKPKDSGANLNLTSHFSLLQLQVSNMDKKPAVLMLIPARVCLGFVHPLKLQ